MGLSGVSLPQLIILLLIVVAIFGTKKLSSLGEDLGKGIKSFRKAMKEDEADEAKTIENNK